MGSAKDSLRQTKVEDVMSRDVITISASQSMTDAARILFEGKIGGAPVVDEMGHCVGVLTSNDFVRLEKDRESICSLGSAGNVQEMIVDRGGSVQIVSHPYGEISDMMSPAVQTIAPDVTLDHAISVMIGEQVHRLIVLDETNRPVGVLSTSDVLSKLLELSE